MRIGRCWLPLVFVIALSGCASLASQAVETTTEFHRVYDGPPRPLSEVATLVSREQVLSINFMGKDGAPGSFPPRPAFSGMAQYDVLPGGILLSVYYEPLTSYTQVPGVGLMMTRYKPVLVSTSAEVKPGRVYRAVAGMRRDEAYLSIEDVTDELKAAVERSRVRQAAQASK